MAHSDVEVEVGLARVRIIAISDPAIIPWFNDAL
jgi:hypothetical protein